MSATRQRWGLLIVLLALNAPSQTRAACPYFRIAAKAEKCVLVKDTAYPTEVARSTSTEDLLTDSDESMTLQLICSCDYSLRGSAPQCDFDRTEEPSFEIPADPEAHTCRRAKQLCAELCPSDLSY